jgi:hypothetical protein
MLDQRVAEGDIELAIGKRHGCGVADHEGDVGRALRVSHEQIKSDDVVLVVEPTEAAADPLRSRPHVHDAVLG